MKKSVRRLISVFVLSAFFALQILPYLPTSLQSIPLVYTLKKASLFQPARIDAAALSSASATLSNPRLSFIGGVSGAFSAGADVVSITAGVFPDQNTNHLFPGDFVGIGSPTNQNPSLRVGNVINTTTFSLNNPLVNGITAADKVYATQSGSITINLYTASPIPNGGSVTVLIPSSASTANDGIPDFAANIASGGFDFNGLTSANITCPGGFTVGTVTGVNGPGNHTVSCNWPGGTLPSGANLTITIGNPQTPGGRGVVNPGAITTGHAVGTADVYAIRTSTYTLNNAGGSQIDDIYTKVAPIEGVLVTAGIDETLTFTVAGITPAGGTDITTPCTFNPAGTKVTTTAYSVPFGASILKDTFYVGAQQLSVSTNAPGGYTVKIEENDQMGKDGKVCPGASAGEAQSCIKDTQCESGTCSESTFSPWVVTTTRGFGYTLSNVTGTYATAAYLYNASGVFSAGQVPDMEAGETKQTIMTHTAPASADSICVVYKVDISGTQPAGNYQNVVKYTATALF